MGAKWYDWFNGDVPLAIKIWLLILIASMTGMLVWTILGLGVPE